MPSRTQNPLKEIPELTTIFCGQREGASSMFILKRASYDLEKKFWQGKCDLEFPKPSMDEAIRWETEDSPDEMASDDSQNGKSKIAYQCLI
jgi:hypothetical protein